MNREIKFRVWHKEQKKFHPSRQYSVSGEGRILFEDGYDCGDSIIAQQFTGLKDKNGNEIYEGDIVKAGMTYQIHTENRNHVVEYKMGGFYPFMSSCFEWRSSIEVLGNIYENPELMEK